MKKMETEKALNDFVIQMEDTLQKHSGEKGDIWNDLISLPQIEGCEI